MVKINVSVAEDPVLLDQRLEARAFQRTDRHGQDIAAIILDDDVVVQELLLDPFRQEAGSFLGLGVDVRQARSEPLVALQCRGAIPIRRAPVAESPLLGLGGAAQRIELRAALEGREKELAEQEGRHEKRFRELLATVEAEPPAQYPDEYIDYLEMRMAEGGAGASHATVGDTVSDLELIETALAEIPVRN